MKKYTPEQKAQALKLLEQDGATSASVARTMGIPASTVRGWASEKAAAPSNVLSIEEMRERAQRAVEATPTAKLLRLKNHFTEKQYELLNKRNLIMESARDVHKAPHTRTHQSNPKRPSPKTAPTYHPARDSAVHPPKVAAILSA